MIRMGASGLERGIFFHILTPIEMVERFVHISPVPEPPVSFHLLKWSGMTRFFGRIKAMESQTPNFFSLLSPHHVPLIRRMVVDEAKGVTSSSRMWKRLPHTCFCSPAKSFIMEAV